ncbi:hypothetical protein, partial [Escherichia coli]|uniref:hypothetical protein n=1 Tax=Escherichia coli TaxID=562 RepID=UPI0013D82207
DYCCYGQDGQLLPNWKAADLARRIERMEYDPDYLNELAEEFEQRKLEEEVRYMEAHAHDHRRP